MCNPITYALQLRLICIKPSTLYQTTIKLPHWYGILIWQSHHPHAVYWRLLHRIRISLPETDHPVTPNWQQAQSCSWSELLGITVWGYYHFTEIQFGVVERTSSRYYRRIGIIIPLQLTSVILGSQRTQYIFLLHTWTILFVQTSTNWEGWHIRDHV